MFSRGNTWNVYGGRSADGMIEKLKSELFDILRQQDILRIEYAKLEKVRIEKIKELEVKEKENGN